MAHYKEMARTFHDKKGQYPPTYTIADSNMYLELAELNSQYGWYLQSEKQSQSRGQPLQTFVRFPLSRQLEQRFKPQKVVRPADKEQARPVRRRAKMTQFNKVIQNYMEERSNKFSSDKAVLEAEMRRCISVDPKNIFLRKLLKAKKIPFYDREQLRKEIPQKLRSIQEKPYLSNSQLKKFTRRDDRFNHTIRRLRKAKYERGLQSKRQANPPSERSCVEEAALDPQSQQLRRVKSELLQIMKQPPSTKWERLFDIKKYLADYNLAVPDLTISYGSQLKVKKFIDGLQKRITDSKAAI